MERRMIHVVLIVLALVNGQLHVKADFFPSMEQCTAFAERVRQVVPKEDFVSCEALQEEPEGAREAK